MLVDLHLHSSASDGCYSPERLVDKVFASDVNVFSLTDHDTVDGLPAARKRAKELGFSMINGIELSVGGDKEIHLLGYGIDHNSDEIKAFCDNKKIERTQRIKKIISILRENHIDIDFDEVALLADGTLSRSHVARILLQKRYVTSIKDAFTRYLQPGRCAHVSRQEISVEQACQMLRRAGGVPVLAHPGLLQVGSTLLEALLREWKAVGLAGVEVFHPSHQGNHVVQLLHLARKEEFIVTGGSDFHGEETRNIAIAQGIDRWQDRDSDVRILWNLTEQHHIGEGPYAL